MPAASRDPCDHPNKQNAIVSDGMGVLGGGGGTDRCEVNGLTVESANCLENAEWRVRAS